MKTALVIPVYNRPNYLLECLNSLTELYTFPDLLVLVNDASTDADTIEMIEAFATEDGVRLINNTTNVGVKECLRSAIDNLFVEGYEIIINLDSDAIVRPWFISNLLSLKKKFPENIISGLNSTNKDLSGNLRHPLISEHEGYAIKKHVGGINMCFNKQDYEKYIRPSLLMQGNWDHNTGLAAAKDDKGIIVTVPSVVQHIGFNSSMGHSQELPDFACDFKRLTLPDVTLLSIDCLDLSRTMRALDISTIDIQFGAVKLLSSIPSDDPRVIPIRNIKDREDYSRFMIKEVAAYIDTKYVLIVHYDGYLLNFKAWDDKFLNYDYIGATWWYKDNMNVGNGGFSLRSKKLHDILADQYIEHLHPEDHHICRTYRKSLEDNFGIKYATEEVANRFAIEGYNSPDKFYIDQLGFHGNGVDFSRSSIPQSMRYPTLQVPPTRAQQNHTVPTNIRWNNRMQTTQQPK